MRPAVPDLLNTLSNSPLSGALIALVSVLLIFACGGLAWGVICAGYVHSPLREQRLKTLAFVMGTFTQVGSLGLTLFQAFLVMIIQLAQGSPALVGIFITRLIFYGTWCAIAIWTWWRTKHAISTSLSKNRLYLLCYAGAGFGLALYQLIEFIVTTVITFHWLTCLLYFIYFGLMAAGIVLNFLVCRQLFLGSGFQQLFPTSTTHGPGSPQGYNTDAVSSTFAQAQSSVKPQEAATPIAVAAKPSEPTVTAQSLEDDIL
eukprot:gnl/Trimastix_PCT/2771.p1 GENE.gnl/Trimastix_PCT/2771~~gnl/Trimastix_PCT/2771.p1  ORF type:complete len:259 (+),score=15.30 gnl/Trimastix_PCT/2771:36-812(+)